MPASSRTLPRVAAFALATSGVVVTYSLAVGTQAAPTADGGGDCQSGGALLSQQFESFPAGTPSLEDERDFLAEFCPPIRYIAGFGSDAEPPLGSLPPEERADRVARERAGQDNGASDTVRLTVDQGVPGSDGQSLRVLYPAGTNTSSHSGAQFEMPIPGAATYEDDGSITGTSHDELYLSYRVRVEDGFDWAQGGKLPGLMANDAADYPDGSNEVSARLMWRAGGKLEFYLHTESDPRVRLLWDNVPGVGHAELVQGEWQTLQVRVKLNTPGRADGIWQGWIDGRLAADYRDLTFRSSPEANLNTVFFSTFHGGSSGSASTPEEIWWPDRDGHIWFDDFVVDDTAGAGTGTARAAASPGQSPRPASQSPTPPAASPVAASPAAVPPPAPSGSTPCSASYEVVDTRSGGFKAIVTVSAGATGLDGWAVAWGGGTPIDRHWGADLTASGGRVVATNASYNGDIEAGGSRTFGLVASGSPDAPGLTCTAS
jgi:Cellulose binding domain